VYRELSLDNLKLYAKIESIEDSGKRSYMLSFTRKGKYAGYKYSIDG